MAEFLKFLTSEDQSSLRERAERRLYEEDATVVREGEERNALFLIRSGSARVERTHMDFRYEIARLGVGEIFGEMSFVEGFVASANVVANEPLEVDVIAASHVEALSERDPGFGARFYHSLAEILSRRLREANVRSASEFSWGGTDPEVRGRRRERYLPDDDDPLSDGDWTLDDDDL